jgi:DNA mismatch endonuclease (patch repair protein)
MADNLKPEDRRKTMQAVKGKKTKLERRLSSMLAGMGLQGWKQNVGDLPGKPDVVFQKDRVVIFIDGCFWHGCPYCNRKLPETNRQYWQRKINRNVELAAINTQKLSQDGWVIIRIWEHEMRDSTSRRTVRTRILAAFDRTHAKA